MVKRLSSNKGKPPPETADPRDGNPRNTRGVWDSPEKKRHSPEKREGKSMRGGQELLKKSEHVARQGEGGKTAKREEDKLTDHL